MDPRAKRACRLPNTVHSEVLPSLPLPTLPRELGFDALRDDEPLAVPDRPEMITQAADIARLLADTDISHLVFTPEDNVDVDPSQCSSLWREVLKHNPDAFKVKAPGPSSQAHGEGSSGGGGAPLPPEPPAAQREVGRGAPLTPEASLTDPQAPRRIQFIDVYGDNIQQKHDNCRNGCVLIKVGRISQCGFILACGDEFCCVLTTERSELHNATADFIITFGDQTEMNFSANSVVVQHGSKLCILFICGGIGRVGGKQPVEFSHQDEMEEAVVYTLSYIRKAYYKPNRRRIPCDRACSYFRGGNIGPVGLQHEGADIFYHNCCVGNDIINGSVVLNGRCEVIGMNLEHSIGWTMSLCLKTIREEIAKMFADTKEMTFAGIKDFLKAKGESEANKISSASYP